MIMLIAQCFYLMLPAYMANMAPVFMKDLHLFKSLDKPLDMGMKYKRKAILGNHKTIRGLIFGILFALITAFVQKDLLTYPLFTELSVIDYSNWILVGFLLGFGALFGDSLKSFVKRRVGVGPGKPFIPWDQIDYSIGALVFLLPIAILSWEYYVVTVVLSLVLHGVANHIAYYFML